MKKSLNELIAESLGNTEKCVVGDVEIVPSPGPMEVEYVRDGKGRVFKGVEARKWLFDHYRERSAFTVWLDSRGRK